MRTKEDILYKSSPYGVETLIPAGTRVRPANDLPDYGLWWVMPWADMDKQAASWQRCYGFLLTAEQVTGEVEA